MADKECRGCRFKHTCKEVGMRGGSGCDSFEGEEKKEQMYRCPKKDCDLQCDEKYPHSKPCIRVVKGVCPSCIPINQEGVKEQRKCCNTCGFRNDEDICCKHNNTVHARYINTHSCEFWKPFKQQVEDKVCEQRVEGILDDFADKVVYTCDLKSDIKSCKQSLDSYYIGKLDKMKEYRDTLIKIKEGLGRFEDDRYEVDKINCHVQWIGYEITKVLPDYEIQKIKGE